MIYKTVEIRDHATCIPALALKMIEPRTETERWAFGITGYDGGGVTILRLIDSKATADAYDWPGMAGGRTMTVAHEWVEANWDAITDGQVVDVRFILGETAAPEAPDRFWEPSLP